MIFLARLLPVWNWLRANPLLALCAVLALWGAYERHQSHKWHQRAVECQTASEAARKAQDALRAKERTEYAEQARKADTRFHEALADARAATDVFVRTHRVQPSGLGPAQPVSEADPAKQPADMSGAVVMVAEPDVQRCADWQAYGVAIHDWALSVSQ